MIEQESVRQKIAFRYSPLLDMALAVLVLQNPERFAAVGSWADRVRGRLPNGLLERLRGLGEQVDLFGLALEADDSGHRFVLDALEAVPDAQADLRAELLQLWEAIAPEVAAQAGLLAESMKTEADRLVLMDPLAFICRFSDRISVAGDGDAIILHWGGGMRVPLEDLDRVLFVPSAFCPRRLMFYRLGSTQIFFYAPDRPEPAAVEEAPESLIVTFSALADATRLKLLRLIAREALPAQEMARRLAVNESTVSRHLRLLTEAGLVGRDRQEGKFLYYRFQSGRMDQLMAAASSYLGRDSE